MSAASILNSRAPRARNQAFPKAMGRPGRLVVADPDDWSPRQMRLGETLLRRLPVRIAQVAREIIGEFGVPSVTALKILDNLIASDRARREGIAALWESGDKEKRSLAQTRAVKLPPLPPARLSWTDQAIRLLEKCIADGMEAGKDEIRAARDVLMRARDESEAHFEQIKKQEFDAAHPEATR